jgi:hypothetical protein
MALIPSQMQMPGQQPYPSKQAIVGGKAPRGEERPKTLHRHSTQSSSHTVCIKRWLKHKVPEVEEVAKVADNTQATSRRDRHRSSRTILIA